jgi:LysM repeat protein
MDYGYIDYPSIIKNGGFNGWSKGSAAATYTKSVDELAAEVIRGDWGNGDIRRQKLTAAGHDYAAVQEKVNEILSGKSTSTTAAYEIYTVVKGDTLWGIAAKKLGSGTRYKEIKTLNGLSSDTIYAGQKLKIPKK